MIYEFAVVTLHDDHRTAAFRTEPRGCTARVCDLRRHPPPATAGTAEESIPSNNHLRRVYDPVIVYVEIRQAFLQSLCGGHAFRQAV